jgi:hypothetical protein
MREKEPIPIAKYPTLRRALGATSEEFKDIQAAFTAQELTGHERTLSEKWDTNFLPQLVTEARKRLDKKDELMQAS